MTDARHARQFAETLLREATELVRQARTVEVVCRQRLVEAMAAERAAIGSDDDVAPLAKRQRPTARLITFAEMVAMAELDEATIFQLIDGGTFPRPVLIGPTAVQWRLSAIQRWKRSGRRQPA